MALKPLVYVVDAFAEQPFAGNPAAICLLEQPAGTDWMQAVAAEMNLSETAFLCPTAGRWALRWFTPTVEVDLCGHATLAAAHVLWELGRSDPGQPLEFQTKSGLLSVVRQGDGMWMDFPALPVTAATPPADVAQVLGAEPVWIGSNGMDLFVELADEAVVRTVCPDFVRLARYAFRGVIVTAPGSAGCDFVSRFFAPASGIPEDPVTGSAHCGLGPYWADRIGRSDLVGFQASTRGGIVRVRVRGDRVLLGGQALTVLRGHLCLPPTVNDGSWQVVGWSPPPP